MCSATDSGEGVNVVSCVVWRVRTVIDMKKKWINKNLTRVFQPQNRCRSTWNRKRLYGSSVTNTFYISDYSNLYVWRSVNVFSSVIDRIVFGTFVVRFRWISMSSRSFSKPISLSTNIQKSIFIRVDHLCCCFVEKINMQTIIIILLLDIILRLSVK
jgi:hypothetical protein